MSDAVENLKRRIARKLGRIFECARLLDLNLSDSDFAARGGAEAPLANHARGDIFYVLDTNILQEFLAPNYRPEYSRLFHDELWDPATSAEREVYAELSQSVGAQSAMLATEYLLSGKLKGTTHLPLDGRVFMTQAHQRELEDQVGYLVRHIMGLDRSTLESKVRGHAKEILRVASLADASPQEVESAIRADKLFIPPNRNSIMPAGEENFRRVRDDYIVNTLCRLLAEDDIVEPIDQLRRFNKSISDNVVDFDWAFSINNDAARETVAKGGADWLSRLKNERQRRQANQRLRSKRFDQVEPRKAGLWTARSEHSDEALATDAETLAQLSWAQGEVTGNERIVFVTGDRLIHDAYRRWFAEHGEGKSFLVRPLAHYDPQFNLKEARGTLSADLQVFDRLRHILEISAFHLTLALMERYSPAGKWTYSRSVGARARDRFSVEVEEETISLDLLKELTPLSENLRALKTRDEELNAIGDAMRWLERRAISAMPHLIKPRTDEATERAREFLEAMENAGESHDQVAEELIKSRLAEAVRHGQKVSIRPAIRQISALAAKGGMDAARFALHLRITLPWKHERLSVTQWLDRLSGLKLGRERVEALNWIADEPLLLYALASLLALRQTAWTDAVRFADFASSASDPRLAAGLDSQGLGQDEGVHYECLYLKSASLRMRMAVQPPTQFVDSDVWRRDLVDAELSLTQCIEQHLAEDHGVRHLRALSERAAVRLTYCAWAATGHLGRLPVYRSESPELTTTFKQAVEDLKSCFAAFPEVQKSVAATRASQVKSVQNELLGWIDWQTHINPECARLIYERLITPFDRTRRTAYLLRDARIESDLESLCDKAGTIEAKGHAVAQIYALSARRRAGEDVSTALANLQLPEDALPLDRAMLDLVRSTAKPA